MRMIWAIDQGAFQAFMLGLQLQLKAWEKLDQFAGPIEDAQRQGVRITKAGSTAVIPIMGPLMKRPGFFMRLFGFQGTEDLQVAVRAALADEDVDRIILRIDTPGGETAGILELANDIRAATATKQVIAQVDGMAASAGYWLASQASTINAGRLDMIGSIGVRILLYDFSKAFEAAGVEAVPIDTGAFKSMGAQGTEITDEHRAYLQGLVDDSFGEFRAAVMSGRAMSAEEFEKVGDGRVFPAPEALELGLIDRIQTMDQTVAAIQQQDSRRRRSAAQLELSRQ